MSKFRSRVNYADIYNSDLQGYNVGLDGSIYLREESVPRTFQLPRIGTQGSSISGATPSTDISAGTDTNFKVNVADKGVVSVTLTLTGLTSGPAIATELELKINAALAAAGYDERVWAQFDGGLYKVYSQFTGVGSTVVITDGDTLNVADDLKLGLANTGVEADGTDDQDKLLYTTGGPSFSQPVESNTHRNGRFHGGIIRKKKVAEFDIDTMVNMSGNAGDSIDQTIRLLLTAVFGTEVVNSGVSITYKQGLPTKYFSLVRVSTIFGEYYNGGYASNLEMEFPGDGPATMKFNGKCSDASIAGLSKVNAIVSASATIPLTGTDESERYSAGSYVMAVAADGRTILYGQAGSLKVDAVDDASNELTLNTAVTLEAGAYIVPWDPGAVQQTARDNIYTDLEGSFKWDYDTGSEICSITSMSFSASNDHNDLDNRFGKSTNQGFIPGNRMTMNMSVTFDLSSAESLGKVVRSRNFAGFKPEVVLGNVASGRYLRIRGKRWIPSVPALDVPENGPTSTTLEGTLYESESGAKDPVEFAYL